MLVCAVMAAAGTVTAYDQATASFDASPSPAAMLGAPALEVSRLVSVGKIIDKLADARIVYVGEVHTKYSHHLVQLDVIRELSKRHGRLAIGMEMFQAPFQKALDDYMAGAIDERTFLKRSGYFTRWGFDYQLYKPIIDFARHSGIPLVALNARRELTEKVSRNGIDSLSPEERRELPETMDFTDLSYRERLRKSFDAHKTLRNGSFDFFVQAQTLWDETMAERIDGFLRGHEGYRMVVLAGNGHLAYGSGIPKRVSRRNGLPSAIVLCDAEVAPGNADFLVFPPDAEPPETPKLMVVLKEAEGRVMIREFPPDSMGERAGLRTGDVLISLDGTAVEAAEDVRIHMLGKRKGDTVRVTVARKTLFFREKTLDVEVRL